MDRIFLENRNRIEKQFSKSNFYHYDNFFISLANNALREFY